MPSHYSRPALVSPLPGPAPAVSVYRRVDLEIVELSHNPRELTLQLSGEMDVISAPLLPAVAHRGIERGMTSVRLDWSRLQFCDCAGLRAVVETHNQLHAEHVAMTISGVRPHLRELFALTHFDEVLHIDDDAAADPFRLGIVDASGTAVRSRRL